MSKVWEIVGHHICNVSSGREEMASIEDIYPLLRQRDEQLLADLPSLRYQKSNAQLVIKVQTVDGQLSIFLQGKVRAKYVQLDFWNNQISDHIVDESGRLFNLIGDPEELSEILRSFDIHNEGPITVRSYLKIVQSNEIKQNCELIAEVDAESLKSQLSSSNLQLGELEAVLYPYQKVGFNWLTNIMRDIGGGILGDEMGLGKTLQVIAVMNALNCNKANHKLVIAPVSLLENWKRECAKFAPSLNVHIHQGAWRTGDYRSLLDYDTVVVAYSTLVNDLSMFQMIKWDLVVIDEAQNIKNPFSQRSKSVRSLDRQYSIAVSGTPFENHITDIWPLVDFISPNLIGTFNQFQDNFPDDCEGAEKIEQILTPLMIRRLVKNVANELPEKVIIDQPLLMGDAERKRYALIAHEGNKDLDHASNDILFRKLVQLRMFCCHEMVYEKIEEGSDPLKSSVKYQRLCEILEEVFLKNEKAIVFTSFNTMFKILRKDLNDRFHIFMDQINGDTAVEQRQSIVDAFNECKSSAVLVLNPRAAGTGLNITGANHVIHYNLEWNPALEDQATARAYRRGQLKTVFVHRLYYTDTVEETINDRLNRKRNLSATAVVGSIGEDDDRSDLLKALRNYPLCDL